MPSRNDTVDNFARTRGSSTVAYQVVSRCMFVKGSTCIMCTLIVYQIQRELDCTYEGELKYMWTSQLLIFSELIKCTRVVQIFARGSCS